MCRLKKVLYGLKQAPRAWYSKIDSYLQRMGFQKSEADPNLYFIMVGDDPLILLLYVDDLFITGRETHCSLQERSCFRVRGDRHWVDALFYGIGGLARASTFFHRTMKVCG